MAELQIFSIENRNSTIATRTGRLDRSACKRSACQRSEDRASLSFDILNFTFHRCGVITRFQSDNNFLIKVGETRFPKLSTKTKQMLDIFSLRQPNSTTDRNILSSVHFMLDYAIKSEIPKFHVRPTFMISPNFLCLTSQ